MYFSCDIIVFSFFSILIQGIISREVPDLTFVLRNVSNKIEPICIADKNILDSAIAWSYPIEAVKDKLPTIVSKYIPELENDYNCDFLKTKPCSSLWQMPDWLFSKFDSHRLKPTLDSRWEDFPTLLTSNDVKEFKNRIDIPHSFEIGISIRGEANAEIFLCAGWNPYSHPCYYISIGGRDIPQVFLRKYFKIPKVIGKNDTMLDNYTREDKFLSVNEWNNFVVSLNDNGTLTLVETLKNETLLNYKDNNKIQPIYLFIRSSEGAKNLWKIHNNHYIFTNKPNLTQLGPTFAVYGDSLCISFYVSMCRFCKMSFYIEINGEKQIIKTVFNENDNDDLLWKEIKLVRHDLLEDKIKLFVETKYVNNTAVPDGFWGIDDVRVCSEDEIKVSRLIAHFEWQDFHLQHVSCYALAVPTWRPIQNDFISNNDEIKLASTSTEIQLSRKSMRNDNHHVQEHYIVQYEGNDICSTSPGTLIKNRSRLKSQGFVVARSFDSVIKDLVPYTKYAVTVWNVIDDIKIQRVVNTLPMETPKTLEMPKNIVIQATDTTCDILWDLPFCNETYGPLVYQVKVYVRNGTLSSTQADTTTRYSFKELQPFSDYEVEIRTARKLENFKDSNLSLSVVYNFTTYSSESIVAPVVEKLEIFATTKNSAHIRFGLPTNLPGKPNTTQVRWCHPLLIDKCNSAIQELTECKLWKSKFCINIGNLTAGFNYSFFVSLKNKATHSYGAEANDTALIVDRVPGIPSSLTYKIRNCAKTIDCCNLNISWTHPFKQGSSITMFDIILTEYSSTYVLDSFKSIHEVLRVTEKTYQPIYNYTIKYVSCSVPYNISVRAINEHYKGQFVSIAIAVNNTSAYVDPMPKYVNSTNETVVFKLPQPESGSEGSSLIVVVQDYNKNKTNISSEINNLEIFDDVNELCNEFGETWIAKAVELNEVTSSLLVIGDATSSYLPQLNRTVFNRPLTPDTEYCFTFTIAKTKKESQHLIVYHDKNLFTEPTYSASRSYNDKSNGTTSVATYLLPVLFISLLVACGAWLSYRYFKKKRPGASSEHIYEAMPFEDYLTDAVSNDTYDRLSHD